MLKSSFTLARLSALYTRDLLFRKRADIVFVVGDDDINFTLNNIRYSKFLCDVENYFIEKGYSIVRVRNDLNGPIRGEPSYSFGSGFIYLFCHVIDAAMSRVSSHEYTKMRFFYWRLISWKFSNTKIIFGIGLRPWHNFSFQKRNIPTVEILHGLGYTWAPWNWDSLDQKYLPGHLVVFDKVSKKTFTRNTKISAKNVHLTKYPNPMGAKIKNEDKPFVLVTLQHNYGGERTEWAGYFDDPTIDSDLENLIAQNPKIIWRIKLHPVQALRLEYEHARNRVADLARKFKNVDIDTQNNSVFELCQGAICHITRSSMSSYEAALAGIMTLAVCPTLQENGIQEHKFEDLVKVGLLKRIPASKIETAMLYGSTLKSNFKIEVEYESILDAVSKNIIPVKGINEI